MSVPVVTLGTATWALIDQIERRHGDVTVVRRCLDLAELLACAHSGMARVALIAEGAEELTASLLEQLALAEVRVLVLEGHDHDRLAALGVPVLGAATPVDDVIAAIERVAHGPVAAPSHRGHSTPHEIPGAAGRGAAAGDDAAVGPAAAADHRVDSGSTADTAHTQAHPGAADAPDAESTQGGAASSTAGVDNGQDGAAASAAEVGAVADPLDAPGAAVITVWGPTGAPGRTVTALNLAAELALSGQRVLLVDADTYAASIAASLGMLEETAGLAQACRLADQGRLDAHGVRRCVTRVAVAGTGLDVLTGLTRHDRWPEIRASALETVLTVAREHYDAVVVDVAAPLESDEEISLDVIAPRRNAAALSACALADTVLALGSADALGIPRLVKALPELLDAAVTARVLVVATKLRRASVGRGADAAVREAWARFTSEREIDATLPWDGPACDEALLGAAVLAESSPQAPLRRAYTELARLVLDEQRSSLPGGSARVPDDASAARTRLGGRVGAWLRR